MGGLSSINFFFGFLEFVYFFAKPLSPHCVGPGIKISRVIVARAKSMHRTDL